MLKKPLYLILVATLIGGSAASASALTIEDSVLPNIDTMVKYIQKETPVDSISIDNRTYEEAKYVLRSGDAITVVPSDAASRMRTGTSKCSLGPVLSKTEAVTARHCGKVGDTIFHNQKFIGTITRVSKNIDISYIRVASSVNVQVNKFDNEELFKGQAVTKRGATTGVTTGYVTKEKEELVEIENHVVIPVRKSNMKVNVGDSGAAVYNERGEVVGIVSAKETVGGFFSEITPQDSYITPLSLLPLG